MATIVNARDVLLQATSPRMVDVGAGNSAMVFLFQRTASATPPSVPGSTLTYAFTTGVLSGTLGSWTQTLPTSGGAYRWATTAKAISTTATDTIATGEWATPALLAQDGTNGANGANGTNGTNGGDGTRGSMTVYVSGTYSSGAATSTAFASAAGVSDKILGDTVVFYDASAGEDRRYRQANGSDTWVQAALYIHGSVVISASLSATAIFGGTFSGAGIDIASSAGGSALQVDYNGTVVEYRTLNGYNITAFNSASPSTAAIKGTSNLSASGPAIEGVATSGSTCDAAVYGKANGPSGAPNTGPHGVRGQHFLESSPGTPDTSGIVGANNNYNFYADGAGATAGDYGTFTGAHDCLVTKTTPTIEPGNLMLDVSVIARSGWSNVITEMAPSSEPNQKGVLGPFLAYASWDGITPNALWANPDTYYAIKPTHDYGIFNGVGEGQMLVCGDGGDIVVGDYLASSSMPGKGMRQLFDGAPDEIHRSWTVAKSREAVTFDYPEQVKTVACIYVAG